MSDGAEPSWGGRGVSDWVAELESSDPDLRETAAVELGLWAAEGEPLPGRVLESLTRALRDAEPVVRAEAALGCAILAAAAGDSSIAMEIVELSREGDPVVQERAARALGYLGSEDARAALIRLTPPASATSVA